jgi:hypothetical protein
MNPKYNHIQFKYYQVSEDGLYKSDANVFCYSIAENMILWYEEGNVIDYTETAFASSVVVSEDKHF